MRFEEAMKIALGFQSKIEDLCKKIEIAGSLRRKEPIVHDIDFAPIPSKQDLPKWKSLLQERLEKNRRQIYLHWRHDL
jgi:DNA polymerase/3'-5' exonuclease PolX